MQSLKEVMDGPVVSAYTGSEITRTMVAEQIKERWGDKEANKYDPYKNALPFVRWASLGYKVKKGEKAIRSITFVEVKDQAGNVVKKFKRKVCLFYYKQVEKVA